MSRSRDIGVLARRIGKFVFQEPAISAHDAVTERDLRLRSERQNAARIHRLARRAAGLGRVERKRRCSPIAVEMGERLAIFCDKALQAFGAKLRKRLVRNSEA